jgi:nucleotide-binding universal stress UspA family protein
MAAKAKKEVKYGNNILIPTDFSEVCGNAISHGVKLAQFLGYKVYVLHVINKETEALLKKKNLGVEYVDKRLKEIKTYYMKKYGIEVNTMTAEGSIFTEINKAATDIKASLMILGTHGKKGLQHVFGSYALKVVMESPVPVVVVQKRSFKHGYHNIILPISTELETRQSVQWAKLMADLFKTKIHLFQAMEKDPGLKSRLTVITHQITTFFDENKIPYDFAEADASGNFPKQVLGHAVMKNSDLIMVMTRPNMDSTGFSISAWNEKLMFNDAQIPVMCINPVELGFYYYDWMQLT